MRRFAFALVLLVLVPLVLSAQGSGVRSMVWGKDYKLHVRLGNDSSYVMDVRGLYHQEGITREQALQGTTTYMPVSLDEEFVSYLRRAPLRDSFGADTLRLVANVTLWSALHHEIGGGYVHLINCIVYALESGKLQLQSDSLRRPVTRWKPDPPTDSYLRTKGWVYYTPVTQKAAHREYKLRAKEGTLQDLQGIPSRFVDLFLETSDKEYRRMVQGRQSASLAQVDLVRMMLGAKYLGEAQIGYVSRCVREAIHSYSASNMPSVIVFDDYKAAVAMTLDAQGYRVDYVVFQDQQSLSAEEVAVRNGKIRQLVANINEANAELFRSRLSQYYNE